MKKLKEMTKKQKTSIGLVAFAVVAIIVGVFITQLSSKPIAVNEGIVFEYGQPTAELKELDLKPIVAEDILDLTNVQYDDVSFINPEEPQTKDIKTHVYKTDEVGEDFEASIFVFNKGKWTEVPFKYSVKDTKEPTIENAKKTYEYDFNADLKYKTEITGKDIVDGELKPTFAPDVKSDKAGEYEVTVTVADKNDNKVTQKIKVVIKEEVKEEVIEETSPETGNEVAVAPENTGSTGGSESSGGGGSTGGSSTGGGSAPAPSVACPGGRNPNLSCDNTDHIANDTHTFISYDSWDATYSKMDNMLRYNGELIGRWSMHELTTNGGAPAGIAVLVWDMNDNMM